MVYCLSDFGAGCSDVASWAPHIPYFLIALNTHAKNKKKEVQEDMRQLHRFGASAIKRRKKKTVVARHMSAATNVIDEPEEREFLDADVLMGEKRINTRARTRTHKKRYFQSPSRFPPFRLFPFPHTALSRNDSIPLSLAKCHGGHETSTEKKNNSGRGARLARKQRT